MTNTGHIMRHQADARISFDTERLIMEADLSDLVFERPEEVETFYDRIEELIAATGRARWFFLVDYRNCRIMPECWLAHSLRGKRLNVTHSLGTVRYDASEETRAEIARRAATEAFDANLCCSRDEAFARIEVLRGKVPAWLLRKPRVSRIPASEFARRVSFDHVGQLMMLDLSALDLESSAEVNALYDLLEARLGEAGGRWYFVINYTGCLIDLRAWISFSQRGKALNEAYSLGSVRYGVSPDIEAEIRAQARRKGFRPNAFRTLEEALACVQEMRLEAAGGSGGGTVVQLRDPRHDAPRPARVVASG